MATHFRILTGTIPWTKDPDGLQSMGLQKVGHDQATEREQIPRECTMHVSIYAAVRGPGSLSTTPTLGTHSPAAQRVFSITPFLSPLRGLPPSKKTCLTQGYSPSPGRGNLYARTSWYGHQKAFPKVAQL